MNVYKGISHVSSWKGFCTAVNFGIAKDVEYIAKVIKQSQKLSISI